MTLFRGSQTGKVYELSSTPFAKGGEGTIYNVIHFPDLLAKVFHEGSKHNSERENKLLVMINNRPNTQGRYQNEFSWPLDLLYDERTSKFSGYMMPKVTEKIPLLELLPNDGPFLKTKPWGLFIRIAKNLSIAISNLHGLGQVVGDLNPKNILVGASYPSKSNIGSSPRDSGLVTLIDVDSFHIHDTRGQLFRCFVCVPDYLPPELQKQSPDSANFTRQSDLFALGVLIFQLLMNGRHPFNCRSTCEISQFRIKNCIKDNMIPYFLKDSRFAIPRNAPPLNCLPDSLQNLFLRAFVHGHQNPVSRPTALEYVNPLVELENNLTQCSYNRVHYYYNRLSRCPWCQIQGQKKQQATPINPQRQTPWSNNSISIGHHNPPPLWRRWTDRATNWLFDHNHRHRLFLSTGAILLTVLLLIMTCPSYVQVPTLFNSKLSTALELVQQIGLTVDTVNEQPHDSIEIGRVIASYPSSGTKVKSMTPIHLTVSSGPELVVVPSVIRLTKKQAEQALKNCNLNPVWGAADYSENVKKDHVVSSDPPAGSQLQKGETVRLTLSLGTYPSWGVPRIDLSAYLIPLKVSVPDVKRWSKSHAEAEIRRSGLSPVWLAEEYDDLVPAGTINSISPLPGTRLTKGSTVQLTLSKGRPPGAIQPYYTPQPGITLAPQPQAPAYSPPQVVLVDVPNLRHWSKQGAEDALRRWGLKPGRGTEQYDPSVDSGKVVSQSPPAGKVAKGSVVTLTLSKGQSPETTKHHIPHRSLTVAPQRTATPAPQRRVTETPQIVAPVYSAPQVVYVDVPNMRYWSKQGADGAVRRLGLTPVWGADVFDQSVSYGTVVSQSPPPGKVAKGSVVTLTMSKGRPPEAIPSYTRTPTPYVQGAPAPYGREGRPPAPAPLYNRTPAPTPTPTPKPAPYGRENRQPAPAESPKPTPRRSLPR